MAEEDDFSVFEKAAVPFITVPGHEDASAVSRSQFEVNPLAIRYLQSLKGKIAVVAIAGMYRTGKSYLLNKLVGKGAGFTVGPTVKACTKGIWLWGTAVEIDGADHTILFLDTEGLGSTIRGTTYDCRVFALALLLSSYFIYNSSGVIDGEAISRLSLVVSLTKHIHVRATAGEDDSGVEFHQHFPNFLWVVRDFGVRLERNGVRMSAREYLEDALTPESGVSDAAMQKNAVRHLVSNFFPNRDCVTMVRPVTDEVLLGKLATVPDADLRSEFRCQLEALRKRVLGGARPKALFGRPLNGPMLAKLAQEYCAALNANQTPTIQSAWDRVATQQCQDAADAGVATYTNGVKAALSPSGVGDDDGAGGGGAADGKPGSHTAAAGAGLPAAGAGAGSGAAADAVASDTASGSGSGSGSGTGTGTGTGSAPPLVLDASALLALHQRTLRSAVDVFMRESVPDSPACAEAEADMHRRIDAQFSKFRKANEAASATVCEAVAAELLAALTTGLQQDVAAQTPPSALAMARAFRKRSRAFVDDYCSQATGSARDRVLVEALADSVPPVIRPHCEAVDNAVREQAVAAERATAEAQLELGTVTSQMAEAEAKLVAAQQREATLQQRLAAARADTEATESKLAKTAEELSAAHDAAKQATAEHAAALAALQSQFDAFKQDAESQRSALQDKLTREGADASSRAAAATDAARADAARLRSELDSVRAALQTRGEGLARVSAEHTAAAAAVARLEQELAAAKDAAAGDSAALAQLREAAVTDRQEVGRLSGELASLRDAEKGLRAEVAEERQRAADLHVHLVTAAEQRAEATSRADRAVAQAKEEVTAAVESARTALEDARAQAAAMEARAQHAEAQVSELRQQVVDAVTRAVASAAESVEASTAQLHADHTEWLAAATDTLKTAVAGGAHAQETPAPSGGGDGGGSGELERVRAELEATRLQLRQQEEEATATREDLEAQVAMLSNHLNRAVAKAGNKPKDSPKLAKAMEQSLELARQVADSERAKAAAEQRAVKAEAELDTAAAKADSAKTVVAALQAELEELRFQFGCRKAELAEARSDKERLQADVNLTEQLAQRMKESLMASGSARLSLDGPLLRRYHEL